MSKITQKSITYYVVLNFISVNCWIFLQLKTSENVKVQQHKWRFLHPVSDRGHQETAEQGSERADQQDAPCPAERRDVAEGGVSAADAGRRSHAGAGLQEPAGRRGPGSSPGQPGQAQTRPRGGGMRWMRRKRRRGSLQEPRGF